MKKSLISWITVLALCLSLLPTAALAEGDGMAAPAQEQGKLVSVPEQPLAEGPAAENGTVLFSYENEENGIDLFSDEVAHDNSHPICGASCSDGAHALPEGTKWQPVSSESELREKTKVEGYYYLTDNITLTGSGSSSIWQPANNTVLCLNGKSIIMSTDRYDTIIVGSNFNYRSPTINFTLTDCHTGEAQGKITHADGMTGNGVVIYPNSTLTMYGGNICGNSTGVAVFGSTFRMYGGTISGNSSNVGGGVYVQPWTDLEQNGDPRVSSYFYMYGGSITGNTARSGGGVYVRAESNEPVSGNFYMYGGSITNNTAQATNTYDNGGGVHVEAKCAFEVSGDARIIDNTKNGEKNNVYLTRGSVMTVGTLGENASIGVTMADTASIIASARRGVTSDDDNYEFKFENNQLVLKEKPPVHTHYLCGGTTGCTKVGHNETSQVTFEPWTDELAKAQYGYDRYTAENCLPKEPGNYYLTKNVSVNYWTPEDGTVLCLNGKTITTESAIKVNGAYGVDWDDPTGLNEKWVSKNFTLCDCQDRGKITRGDSHSRIVEVNSGTFNLYGGELTNGYIPSGATGENHGGGVLVYSTYEKYLDTNGARGPIPGTFNMYGGSITGSTGIFGGGVSVEINAVFNLYDGSITGNWAGGDPGYGGGVCVAGGTFNMSGGSIARNETVFAGGVGLGGGVYVTYGVSGTNTYISGTFNMSGGSITGGDSDKNVFGYGGGVYVNGDSYSKCGGVFNMSGGTISGNKTQHEGGGVYVDSYGSMTVSGDAKIFDNKMGGKTAATATTTNNVYLPSGKAIAIGEGGLTTGTSIGVTTGATPTTANPVTIATNAQNGDEGYFKSDASGRYPVFENGEVQLSINKPHTHYLCGSTTKCTCPEGQKETSQITFKPWTDDKSLPDTADNYYLTKNVTLSSTWKPANGTVLDLNGNTITADGDFAAITIEGGGSFTLVDCWSREYGKITHANTDGKTGRGVYVDNGSFAMYGGNITGNTANDLYGHGGGVLVANLYGNTNGRFTMYGGTISNNAGSGTGGGVYVSGDNGYPNSKCSGTFTMYGGTISGNTSDDDGGGVFVANGYKVTAGSFTMYGGTISDNTAKTSDGTGGCGGGVYVAKYHNAEVPGSFTMYDGTIINNTAGYGGGGVYADGKFTMKDGTISGNTAYNGGGALVPSGFTMEDGTISGNTATKGSGGGVYARGSFTMENGKITGNTAKTDSGTGGGVYAGGSFTMKNGEISGNTAEGYQHSNYTYGAGGGVLTEGRFTMSGGTISGNKATYGAGTGSNSGNGGGVCVLDNSFTMSGGTIENNEAVYGGGGVCVYRGSGSSHDFTMTGGTITGNRVSTSGDGGGVWTNCTEAKVSGIVKITGNVKTGTPDAVTGTSTDEDNNFFYVESLSHTDHPLPIKIDGSGLTTGAKIGINVDKFVLKYLHPSSPVTVVTNATAGDLKYFSADAGDPHVLEYKEVTDSETGATTGTIVLTKPVVHEHDWTYALNETKDTITAACENTDDSCPNTNGGSVTISAPTSLAYDSNDKPATLVNDLVSGITAPTITYTKDGSSTGTPRNAGSYTASITLGSATASVTYTIEKADPSYTVPTNLSAAYGQTLTNITLPDGWSWMDNTQSVGSVGTHTFKATFTPSDTVNYNTVTVDVTVTVNKAAGGSLGEKTLTQKYTNTSEQTVTLDWSKLPAGQTWNYSCSYALSTGATASVDDPKVDNSTGKLTYQISNGSKDDVITFTVTAFCNNYKNFTWTVKVTLTDKDPQRLTFASSMTKTYGDGAFRLTATNDRGSNGGAITYTSSDPTVATVDSATGEVTILKAGETVITATAAATSDYAEGSARCTLTVNKATITITAKDLSAYVGDAVPTPDYTVTGLVGGDELTALPSIAYETTPDMSKAGTFRIIVSGAAASENYTIEYVNGTLTVAARQPSGGGVTAPVFPIGTPDAPNGTIIVTPKNAPAGATVTIVTKPNDGYQLGDLSATDSSGNQLPLTDMGGGSFTFLMPNGTVNVRGSFVVKTEESPFRDVSTGAYYYDAVKWAVGKDITSGIGSGLFGPNQSCTRAQIVTFLWRAAGSPEPTALSSFTDVAPTAYYAKAVAWAVENGVTTGTSATEFSPNAPCTRAQAVTFLYRALKAAASGSSTAFSDVAADAYYASAVAWAVENGVTTGVGDGLFAPKDTCTRAQIVTFLYRAYQGK